MIVDRLEHWNRYFQGPHWQKVFTYLSTLSAQAPETEMTPLQGDEIMARVMVYDTRGPEEGTLEAHDRYVDIQMSLENSEAIEWFPRDTLTVKTPYDSATDAVFFERPGPAPARVINVPGQFVALFPEDAHLAQQMPEDAPERVRKVVVKLRVDCARLHGDA